MSTRIEALGPKLLALYRDIAKTARSHAPAARILVLGYPRLFPDDPPTRCGAGSGRLNEVPEKSMQAINTFVDGVNSQIEASAADAGVEYVDVADAFDDHGLCVDGDDDRWVNRLIPSDYKQSMHPTARGQQAFAARVALCLSQACDGSVPTPILPPPPPPPPPPAPLPPPAPCQTSQATWTPGRSVVASAGGVLRLKRDPGDDAFSIDVEANDGWYVRSSTSHSRSKLRGEARHWSSIERGGLSYLLGDDVGARRVTAVFSNCPLPNEYISQSVWVTWSRYATNVFGSGRVLRMDNPFFHQPLLVPRIVTVRAYSASGGIRDMTSRRTLRPDATSFWRAAWLGAPSKSWRRRGRLAFTIGSEDPRIDRPPTLVLRLK